MKILEIFSGPKPENLADLNVKIQEAMFLLPSYWKERLPSVRVILTSLTQKELERRITISHNSNQVISYTNCGTEEAIQAVLDVADIFFLYNWTKIFLREYPGFVGVIREQAKPIQSILMEVNLQDGSLTSTAMENVFPFIFPQFVIQKDILVEPIVQFLIRVDQMVKHGHMALS